MNQYDDKETYCRKLGHDVSFSYCRACSTGLPCRKVLDCWYAAFAVGDYLKSHYTPAELARVFEPQKPKVAQILDIVASVKRNAAAE